MANVIEGTEPMLSGPPKKIGIGDAVFGVSVADILREAANAIKKARPYEMASPYETVEVIK